MRHPLDSLFTGWRPLPLTALAIALSSAIGVVDYATGFELSFSIFYLAPIALVAWYGDSRAATALCLISAAMWFYVDQISGRVYSHGAIPVWNALVRLGFFSISASLLVTLRAHLRNEELLARRDSLTGLLNARAFKEQARTQLALAARQRQPLAIAYLDLDDFKLVNDRLGHSEGDRALEEVAAVLASRLRQTDLVGRLGGDEFATLLPNVDADGAATLFGEIGEALRRRFAERDWPLGVSTGIAVFAVAPASLDAALHAADELMYEVKATGKNSARLRRFEAPPAAVAAETVTAASAAGG